MLRQLRRIRYLIAMAVIWAGSTSLGDSALAPQFDLSWFTIDGGGVMLSGDGRLEMSGTIGQHDAGEPMTGRGFTLTAGFWFPIAQGDCNTDGGVNVFDYDDFTYCATGPDIPIHYPECKCADFDGDNDVDLLDWSEFQVVFTGR